MHLLTLATWGFSVLIQAALLVVLLYRFAPLPMFKAYLFISLTRTLALMVAQAVTHNFPEAMATVWLVTAAFEFPILVCAVVEACLFPFHRTATAGTLTGAGVLALFVVALGVLNAQPMSLFGIRNSEYAARAAALVVAAVALAITGAAGKAAFTLVFSAYCALDSIACWAIVAGAARDPRTGRLVVFGQTACLVAWLWQAWSTSRQRYH